jgi:hypothetical protein
MCDRQAFHCSALEVEDVEGLRCACDIGDRRRVGRPSCRRAVFLQFVAASPLLAYTGLPGPLNRTRDATRAAVAHIPALSANSVTPGGMS